MGCSLITGASSGIGLALARLLLQQGHTVLGLQRRQSPLSGTSGRYFEVRHDLGDVESTQPAVHRLLEAYARAHGGPVPKLDRVILNAGVAAPVRLMVDTPLADLQRLMTVNAWSNKAILDALLSAGVELRSVVGLSSGAATRAIRGWNGYCVSKAGFRMLLELYAAEQPGTHFCSLAPGLVATPMQDELCDTSAAEMAEFPSLQRLLAARGTPAMPSPQALAPRLLEAMDRARGMPTGSFVDLRDLTLPG